MSLRETEPSQTWRSDEAISEIAALLSVARNDK